MYIGRFKGTQVKSAKKRLFVIDGQYLFSYLSYKDEVTDQTTTCNQQQQKQIKDIKILLY